MSEPGKKQWQPPHKDINGHFAAGDWRPIRNAIEAALSVVGEPTKIEPRDWDLVLLALHHYEWAGRPNCMGCHEPVAWHEAIRCLDCKAPLHERCAPVHFWPNGRDRK